MSGVAVGTLAVSAGVAGYQAYQGNQQKKKGRAARKRLTRPTYEIPQEVLDNLSDAEKQQVQGLPAEQKAEYVKNIERSQQASLKQSADRRGGLMGVQASASQQNDAYTNLVSMDAAARKESELRKQANVRNARGAVAGGKDKQFDISKQDYGKDLASANAMIGAGMQNEAQAVSTIGSAVTSYGSTLGGGGSKGKGGGQGQRISDGQTQGYGSYGSFDSNNIPKYTPTNY